MRSTLVAVVCALGVAAAGARPDDKADPAAEFKTFHGTWTFESVESGGKALPADLFKGMTVTFEGDRYSVRAGDKVVEAATQKLDPSKSPKTLDATVTDGPNKGSRVLGIYEISGDTPRVSFDPARTKRPTEFKTAAGSATTLVVHRRTKK